MLLQGHLHGATIAPVIIASDKTHLSNFSSNKSVWPVYLTIGNIEKSTHRQPSAHATVLISYILVSKIECFSKEKRQYHSYQVFHDCMHSLLAPLKKAGEEGIDMVCADGFIHWVFPILCAYVADYPKQCLVACNNENHCPWCDAGRTKLGCPLNTVLKSSETVLQAMDNAANGNMDEYTRLGLHPNNPF